MQNFQSLGRADDKMLTPKPRKRRPMTITWAAVQNEYASTATDHLERAQVLGLECPCDVFEQLFHDHHGDEAFAGVVRFIDWANVEWEETAQSGVALRRVSIPRPYQHAVDEARWRTVEEGVQDERPEIIGHWQTAGTWLRSPILIAGEVMGLSLGNECLVGFTRLGNLLGLLDRQEVPEAAQHRVWLGRGHAVR
jgi:hypothetical protein